MIGYQNACSIILIALIATGPALAQSRNGNVWDGFAHQPNPSVVRDNEKAKGVLASPQEQTRRDDILDRLGRQLLERSNNGR
jgi:hypothetical protein